MAACVFSAWVTVASLATNGDSLESKGLTLPGVVLIYFGGAVMGGIVYAASGPLFRWRLGAGLGGSLVMAPFFTAVMIALPEYALDSRLTWATIAVSSVLMGGVGAMVHWEPE